MRRSRYELCKKILIIHATKDEKIRIPGFEKVREDVYQSNNPFGTMIRKSDMLMSKPIGRAKTIVVIRDR